MTTEFVLIRHGQTAWNAEGRLQGTSNTELNELGIQQAQALADAMSDEEWDVVAASPLHRAFNTSLPVAEALGIPEKEILLDERLMERHYGIGEGMLGTEIYGQHPDGVWDGIEPIDDLIHRAVMTLDDYVSRFPNNRIVLVTHGTWINNAIGALSNGEFGPGITQILNTSRTYLSHDGEKWRVGDVSVADHLAALV